MPEFDFSEFHDLMHPIGSADCRAEPGGIWRHLQMKWDYQWYMPNALWERPLHALGKHYWTEVWTSNGNVFTETPDLLVCSWCGIEKSV